MKRKVKLGLILFFLSGLISCQTNPSDLPNDLHRIKLDVVHILQQDDYSCATTSLAMAISYFEQKRLDKNEVWKISGSSVFDVKQYGNDMGGLKRIADHYGYKGEFREGLSINDLEKFIFDGIPVVINVLQHEETTATHAVLVVGYDSPLCLAK